MTKLIKTHFKYQKKGRATTTKPRFLHSLQIPTSCCFHWAFQICEECIMESLKLKIIIMPVNASLKQGNTLSVTGCQRHSQSKNTQVFQWRCWFLMDRIYCSITLLCKSGKPDLAVTFSKQIQLYILHLSLFLCLIKHL